MNKITDLYQIIKMRLFGRIMKRRDFLEYLHRQRNTAILKATSHDILNSQAYLIASHDNDYYLKNERFFNEIDLLFNVYDFIDNLANSYIFAPSISTAPDTKDLIKLFSCHFYDFKTEENFI